MNIGLVRHYKVIKKYPSPFKLVSTEQLAAWFTEYDEAPIEKGNAELGGIRWDRCLSSDLSRALQTAESLFGGQIEKRPELREIPLPRIKSRIKLPFLWWAVIARVTWSFNRQARAEMKAAEERIAGILDEVIGGADPTANVLIVSHGALMDVMKKELDKRGFRGPKFSYPENGKLYTFTRGI
ncbi:histidine phosphatase family protein [Paenibacillus thermotolerans]|uniref:histidine phosphatase family protein n=1 Tax=Paenibacillus thermotolerans TaxID=3027807 RepID=UPI002368762B|nr:MULTISPECIES: histidine phosphatase family protein [unclassified Paenibacillus]